MNYSITKRKMGVGPKKGLTMYIARAVCQKQRVSFDKLCEFMADGSTVSQADVAAVFYKFRTVLNLLCSQGNIVDADRWHIPSYFYCESCRERRGF